MNTSKTLALETKVAAARNFHAAMVSRDWDAIRSFITDDAVWSLPGTNKISGVAEGAESFMERAQLIASFGIKIELRHVFTSRENVVITLHNTGERDGRILDEQLVSAFYFRGEKTCKIESFLSDVPMMDRFFI